MHHSNSRQSPDVTSQCQRGVAYDGLEDFFDETTEFADDYGPGKLHPVHFGDTFKDSRYKVLRKLGAGSFSTVWLARDRMLDKYIALKITTAKSSAIEVESKIFRHLSDQNIQHPGKTHITTLLDSFEHEGPNGFHRCLVFDVMGPNSSTMFSHLPPKLRPPPDMSAEPSESNRGRLPFWMAKSIIKQTLLGIDFLHKSGIVHGDLQPGNILFSVKDLSSLRESDLAQSDPQEMIFRKTVSSQGEVTFQDIESKSLNLQADFYSQRHVNGKPDPSAPRYIVMKEPMFQYVSLDPPLLAKISDLGGAFCVSKPPAKPVTPLALRSPEMILGEPISEAQDIWSFGCLVFEFLTGRKLFSVMPPMPSDGDDGVFSEDEDGSIETQQERQEGPESTTGKLHPGDLDAPNNRTLSSRNAEEQHETTYDENNEMTFGTDDSTDDDHILQMAAVLGPVPLSFLAKFPRSNIYFNDAGEVTKHYVDEPIEEDNIRDIVISPPIATFLDQEQGADLGSEDSAMVKELLQAILQFDPAERPSAEMLLAHPWFDESATNIG